LVEIDEELPASEGYAIRFMVYVDDADIIGLSTVRAVADRDYDTTALRVLESNALPAIGEVVHIGPMGTESMALRIKGIEGAQDQNARVIMVADAPEIDALTDAEVPPAWDGRVGEEIAASVLEPAVPNFVHIRTGVDGTGIENGLEVLLKPGTGSSSVVTSYEIDHRSNGTAAWTTITVPAASASADIAAYVLNDFVDIRARAIATTVPSDYTPVVTVTIGSEDPAIPGGLDDSAIDVLGSLGRAHIGVGIPPDPAIAQLQIYRSPQGASLDRSVHAVREPFAVEPSSTASFTDGDATRAPVLSNGGFNTADNWSTGVGWSISGGSASHMPSAASDLSKDVSCVEGATYRIAFTLSGRTAGTVTPQLTGGATVAGDPVSANGLVQISLVAGAGSDAFTLAADATFDGTIDDVIIYRETATSVAAGSWSWGRFWPIHSYDFLGETNAR